MVDIFCFKADSRFFKFKALVMFVVYSPEGQNKIRSVQQLPVQRVNSVHRVNQVQEGGLDSLNTEESTANNSSALRATNLYKKNQQQESRKVSNAAQIMSNPVIAIAEDSSLENAWNLMQQQGIKHLPVIRDGKVAGMCTQEAVLLRTYIDDENHLNGDLDKSVHDVMQTTVVTATSDTDVRHIAQALTEFDIDVLVVMDDSDEVKGIITEKDLISRLAKEPPLEIYI